MVLCAILSACAKWVNTKKKERKKTLQAEAIMAAVAGIGIFALHMALDFNEYLGCFFSLVAGLLGANGIEAFLKEQAAKKVGLPIESAKDEKEGEKK